MPHHSSSARQAFTLLEMALVVAIVGLLVGGLLGVRTYIKNAQLTTMINESKYFINGFNRFQTMYNVVPGDMSTASSTWGCGSCNGDGNGVIRAVSSGAANTAELYLAFSHLSAAGFIQGNYTGAAVSGGARAGTNVPASSMQHVAFMFDHPDAMNGNVSGDSLYFDGLYSHVLRVAGLGEAATSLPADPFLTPSEAFKADDKYDDGKPSTGWIMTPKYSALSDCATSNTVSTTAYNVNYDGAACYLLLRLQ